MTAVRQFAVVLLWLVSYFTPAMACAVSDAHMNVRERPCCQAMKNQCEQMGMSPSHGCCQKTLQALATMPWIQGGNLSCGCMAMIWLTADEWFQQTSAAAGGLKMVTTRLRNQPPVPSPLRLRYRRHNDAPESGEQVTVIMFFIVRHT